MGYIYRAVQGHVPSTWLFTDVVNGGTECILITYFEVCFCNALVIVKTLVNDSVECRLQFRTDQFGTWIT